ncbi:MAG: hypothetical protein JWN00_1736 [Actinomycetia bacterium]|nr:hypothetical protein [Actinomycetes bacterium]
MSSDLHRRAAAITTGGASSIQDEERAVLAVFDAASSAWTDGDANAFVEWYAEDATVILPGFYLRGKADVRAGMGNAFAGPLQGSERIHTIQSVRFLSDDTAIVITRSATTFPGEAEPPAERWESATWVLSKGEGRWLFEAYHSCAAGAEPAGADPAP